jgi:hypothetical protein
MQPLCRVTGKNGHVMITESSGPLGRIGQGANRLHQLPQAERHRCHRHSRCLCGRNLRSTKSAKARAAPLPVTDSRRHRLRSRCRWSCWRSLRSHRRIRSLYRNGPVLAFGRAGVVRYFPCRRRRTWPRKPTSSALFARHREISVCIGLRGG